MKSLYLLILLLFIQPLSGMRTAAPRPRTVARASTAMKLATRVVAQCDRMHHTQYDLARTLSAIAPHKIKLFYDYIFCATYFLIDANNFLFSAHCYF